MRMAPPFRARRIPSRWCYARARNVSDVVMGLFGPDSSSSRWILVNARPILNEATGAIVLVVASFVDITKRQQTQDSLRASEARKSAILEASLDAIITIDHEGRITDWNLAAEQMFHIPRSQVMGSLMGEVIVPPALRDAHRQGMARYLDTGNSTLLGRRVELSALRADGSEFPIELTISRIPGEGPPSFTGFVRDITRRKAAEQERAHLFQEVEAQRLRLDNIVANVPGMVWEAWGSPDQSEQQIRFISEYTETMLGYSIEEWLSSPNFWLRIVHPDDQEQAAQRAAEHFANGQGGANQFRWIAKDGRVVWADVRSTIIFDEAGVPVGMRGVAMDITERKRAEEATSFMTEASKVLASSLDYQLTLTNLARLAVPTLADWCIVQSLDEAHATQTLALEAVDADQLSLAQLLLSQYPLAADAPVGLPHVLRTGEAELIASITPEVLALAVQDAEHLALLQRAELHASMIVPLSARGRMLGAITLVSTTSRRTYTQQDVAFAQELARRAAIALDNAYLYEEARDAVRMRDAFLSLASHELKTPLTALYGYATLLQRRALQQGNASPQEERAVNVIADQAQRMSRMIDRMLDMSNIEHGQFEIVRQRLDLRALAVRLVEQTQETRRSHPIRFEGSDEPLLILGDELRLEQVLHNLLQNAMKYSPGGGRLWFASRRWMNLHSFPWRTRESVYPSMPSLACSSAFIG